MRILPLFLFMTLCTIDFHSYCQNISDSALFKLQFHSEKGKEFTLSNNMNNETGFLPSLLFITYKSFFSSQDLQSCSFYPSCSAYGYKAVKKRGLFIGIFSTFDRLSRCNGHSPHLYPVHSETGLLYDPVSKP